MDKQTVRLRTLCGCTKEILSAVAKWIEVPYRNTTKGKGVSVADMWPAFSHDPEERRELRMAHEAEALGPMERRTFKLQGFDEDRMLLYVEVPKGG